MTRRLDKRSRYPTFSAVFDSAARSRFLLGMGHYSDQRQSFSNTPGNQTCVDREQECAVISRETRVATVGRMHPLLVSGKESRIRSSLPSHWGEWSGIIRAGEATVKNSTSLPEEVFDDCGVRLMREPQEEK